MLLPTGITIRKGEGVLVSSAPTQVDLVIQTGSRTMTYNDLPPVSPPKITLNGAPFPAPQGDPYMPSGWQVAVIDPTKDITDPASIVSNAYIQLWGQGNTNEWSGTYQYMYDAMATQILNSGNIEQQLLLIVSYGLDNNAPPTNFAYEMLLGVGAGPLLQEWETTCDPGSQAGNPESWVSNPANYILVGYSAYGYGQGYEAYSATGDPVETELSVTLYNHIPPA